MSKRFTETGKWDDPWFRKLSPAAKLLWGWMLDKCDQAGVIDMDLELAAFQIGLPMGVDTLSELGRRVEQLECGKCFIPAFIPFQVGTPSRDCKAHNPIFLSIDKHKIERVSIPYQEGIDTLQEKERVKDKETEEVKDGIGGAGGKGIAPVKMNELGDWIEKIRNAYPRKGEQQDCRHAIRAALDAAHQTPQQILDDVLACAIWVNLAEEKGTCQWVPCAGKFFSGRQWTDPKKFEGISLRVKEAQNGTNKNHVRASGDLNKPGRYT